MGACQPEAAADVIVVQAKYGSAVPAHKGWRGPQHYAVRRVAGAGGACGQDARPAREAARAAREGCMLQTAWK